MVKFLVKKGFWVETFSIYQKMGLHSFIKTFGLTSGTSVKGTVGLTLVRKGFKCFNFYSIDYSIDVDRGKSVAAVAQ